MTRKATWFGSLLIVLSVALSGCFLGHLRGQGNAFAADESAAGSSDSSEDLGQTDTPSLSVR